MTWKYPLLMYLRQSTPRWIPLQALLTLVDKPGPPCRMDERGPFTQTMRAHFKQQLQSYPKVVWHAIKEKMYDIAEDF